MSTPSYGSDRSLSSTSGSSVPDASPRNAGDAKHELSELPVSLRRRITLMPSPAGRQGALQRAGRDPHSLCWSWNDSRNNAGYGTVKGFGAQGNNPWEVHRLVWRLLVDSTLPKPGKARRRQGGRPTTVPDRPLTHRDDTILDHLCERRSCCNPHHIERISQSENTKRGARHRDT